MTIFDNDQRVFGKGELISKSKEDEFVEEERKRVYQSARRKCSGIRFSALSHSLRD